MSDINATSELPASIAFITSYAPSLKNFRGPLIRTLCDRGVRCSCLAPDFDDSTREQVRALGGEPVDFKLNRLGLNPVADLVDAFRLSRRLRRLNPDMVICYFIKPVIFGSLAAAVAGVKRRVCLIEGLGSMFAGEADTVSMKHRLVRQAALLCYRFALSFVERVFLCNPDNWRFFVEEKRLIVASKATLIPGIGVDLEEFALPPPVRVPVTFIMVARLLLSKGVREFVEAARMVRSTHPEARFILVGDTDVNPDSISREEASSWSESSLIEWTGQVPDVRPWLSESSVVVLPSRYPEGLPRSLMEGLAAARPIITTDTPGCRETVVEGKNGYFVPACDSQALAAIMRKFIENPELVVAMGKESRRLAEAHFDVQAVNEQIVSSLRIR